PGPGCWAWCSWSSSSWLLVVRPMRTDTWSHGFGPESTRVPRIPRDSCTSRREVRVGGAARAESALVRGAAVLGHYSLLTRPTGGPVGPGGHPARRRDARCDRRAGGGVMADDAPKLNPTALPLADAA